MISSAKYLLAIKSQQILSELVARGFAQSDEPLRVDISRATGGDETLPLDEVRRVHAEAVGFGDALRGEQLFGPPVSVPEDASEQDKLIAFLGRTP